MGGLSVSLKPIKKSDAKKLDKMKAKKRTTELTELPPRILIVSEGTKTEPYYFEILAEKINSKSSKMTSGARVVVEVEGTGRNTTGLYSHLENKYTSADLANYKQIWLVYDKDDFPKDRFDNAASKAKERNNSKFNAAWSNQSFELWLVWHFQDYYVESHRKEYIKVLDKYVSHYEKGDKEVYYYILKNGDIKEAIKRAKRQEKMYVDDGVIVPSQMKCASTVYKLVEELMKYIN